MRNLLLFQLFFLLFSCGETVRQLDDISRGSVLTLDFKVANTSETASLNPFTDYRLETRFIHPDTSFTIQGFYAADGNAAETSADSGDVWRVHFRVPLAGQWQYETKVYQDEKVVYAAPEKLASLTPLKTEKGQFTATAAAAGERGQLVRNHPRYLQWSISGDHFIKVGPGSPENLLAYAGFDGTYRYEAAVRDGESTASKEFLHQFTAHEKDFKPGDLTWQDGKGKGLIGALNYLASKGMNTFYFLSMNILGDGKDVWPYTDHETFDRFDVSKLAQWEKVFSYADDELEMMLHFITAETENETMLDRGDTGPLRQLYFRELVARFGHHRAITWNLGEENGPNSWTEKYQTNDQQLQMAEWFEANDPYHHHVAVHTHPNIKERKEVVTPLLGNTALTGLSMQIHAPYETHAETKYWLAESQKTGHPWIVAVDEIGPWFQGLDHDARTPTNNQDSVRALVLWGHLMAGGTGVEWYFGAHNPHNDLMCEDFRSRDRAFTWSGHARRFFETYLPFHEMQSADELIDGQQYCFAKPGEVYAIYLPFGGTTSLDLSGQSGSFKVQWYDPRSGGELQRGSLTEVQGGGQVELGDAPGDGARDWAVLVRRE